MRTVLLVTSLALAASRLAGQSPDGLFAQGAIGSVLDAWHAAAAAADEERYFSYFTPDAVFLGTDATERWTRDEFRKWARPYFAKGRGWTYRATARWISFAPDRRVAWFDETLENAGYGTCRGSGVLVATDSGWKIAQYNLSIPIPNGISGEIVKRIADYGKTKKGN
jgi:uncharacterized protein (TIGR02246 family)